jgi:diguanylate cyclase (GGDEF)-like protein
MHLFARQDRWLLAGLALAVIVVVSKPLQFLLDAALDVERTSGLLLIPALLILSVFFLFQQQSKRQEAKMRAATAEAESLQATLRAAELERLGLFGQALGRCLDFDAIRAVLLLHLEALTGTPDACVVARIDHKWAILAGRANSEAAETGESGPSPFTDALLTRANQSEGGSISWAGSLWWPMKAAGQVVGLVGVPESAGVPFGSRQRVVATAATLLGISLRNADLFQELRDNSVRDGLTGCFNRTHAMEIIEAELRRARRSHLPVSLIMFDVDQFKEINDRYGHQCGDAVLIAVGACMREVLRGSDVKCRYGGDEFMVLLPDTPIEGARYVADTLRRELSERPIRWKEETLAITASFGATIAKPSEIDTPAFITRADVALYRAKDQGRNCVCLSNEPAVA